MIRLGAAPNADDQVHRDEAAFEEDVEQEQVLRREGAHDERLHQQEGRHIFGHALARSQRQLAPMQIGIRKAVSAISNIAMPSMPSAQLTPPTDRQLLDELPLRSVRIVIAPKGRG